MTVFCRRGNSSPSASVTSTGPRTTSGPPSTTLISVLAVTTSSLLTVVPLPARLLPKDPAGRIRRKAAPRVNHARLEYPHRRSVTDAVFGLASVVYTLLQRGIGHLLRDAFEDHHVLAALRMRHHVRVRRQVSCLPRAPPAAEVEALLHPHAPHRHRMRPAVGPDGR